MPPDHGDSNIGYRRVEIPWAFLVAGVRTFTTIENHFGELPRLKIFEIIDMALI
jgi:hypothetical protein